MAVEALVDTGAILAVLDEDDRWHASCSEAFSQFRLPLLTSHAVLTELFHLVGGNLHEIRAAWKFIRSGAITVAQIADAELAAIEALMDRYHDRPMDYADATLVHLAERESLTLIFTVDHDDFETYRIAGRKRFRIVPARHAVEQHS